MEHTEADRLLHLFLDVEGVAHNSSIAFALFEAVYAGIMKAPGDASHVSEKPARQEEVYMLCTVFNMSPQDVDAMDYAKLTNMINIYNEMKSDKKIEPPSEEEMKEILRKYEPKS